MEKHYHNKLTKITINNLIKITPPSRKKDHIQRPNNDHLQQVNESHQQKFTKIGKRRPSLRRSLPTSQHNSPETRKRKLSSINKQRSQRKQQRQITT